MMAKVLSTKRYYTWKLVYTEEFTTSADAMVREKYFKSGIGRTVPQTDGT
jgi:predicted GIY-YIG superfamily endonuclease